MINLLQMTKCAAIIAISIASNSWKIFVKKIIYNYLLEGSNEDDKSDYRPGMIALKEFEIVKSPFLELHITKDEIRQMAKNWNLPVWNKPSSACLASRLAYGIEITPEKLNQIAQAEAIIRPFVNGQMRVCAIMAI